MCQTMRRGAGRGSFQKPIQGKSLLLVFLRLAHGAATCRYRAAAICRREFHLSVGIACRARCTECVGESKRQPEAQGCRTGRNARREFSYPLQFKPASRRMFTLRENMLFCEKWTRSFELESVLFSRWTAKNAVQFNKKRQAFSCWFCSLGFHFSLAQAFTPGNVGEPSNVFSSPFSRSGVLPQK
jgi:hypothetical protein